MPVTRTARSARWLWGATGLGLVALFVGAAFWDPAAHPGPVFCLFRRTTGIACPACGLTRAAALLGRGQLAASVATHPLLLPLLLELAVFWALWRRRLTAADARFDRWAGRAALATAALLLVVWVWRLAIGTLPA